jgi:hypothetical protein
MSSVPILGPRLSWVEKPMRMVPHTQPARSVGLLLGMRLEFARCAERRSEKMPFSLIIRSECQGHDYQQGSTQK